MTLYFEFCPACGNRGIRWLADRFWRCPACGFEYFHNIATSAGVIAIRKTPEGREILVVQRAKDPAKGKIAFPGGFVDPGERAEEAASRECGEELGWVPGELTFLASFPNRYRYRSVEYNTCDIFFTTNAEKLESKDLAFDPDEIESVRWLPIPGYDPGEIAFESARKALMLLSGSFPPT